MWAGPGKFYSRDKERLIHYLDRVLATDAPRVQARAVIMPHAGYAYSGAVAAKTITKVKVPDTVLLLGPNHTGLGRPYSLMSTGVWKTPLGEVPVQEPLAKLLLEHSEFICEDETAHVHEHSIEVQLPFLQYLNAKVSIVPIVVSDQVSSHFTFVAGEMAKALTAFEKPVLIVASSDMTHYEPQEKAKSNDAVAIEAILALDPVKLLAKVKKLSISMCGVAPVALALFMCRELGARRAELIEYQTSGDTSGDYASVVGYAGVVIT
jgi:AmmeMemoRadiSam system protein B